MSWLQQAIEDTLDASKREVIAHWQDHLSLVDSMLASPDTTAARFKEVVDSCRDFNLAIEDVHKRHFVRVNATLGELEGRLQAHIDGLGTGGKPTENKSVLRLRAVKKAHIDKIYRHTPARIVSQLKVSTANDFAGAVHEIRQYRVNPADMIFLLEKEKRDAEEHPRVEPFVVDGFCVGPATRNGRPLVLRQVCRHCTTVFHGKCAREVVSKRPYLETLLLRQCPSKPEVLCVDSLELARITHTGPSDEYVVSLRDAYKEHYKSVRAEANKRYYANRRDIITN